MAKQKSSFNCQQCGYQSAKWLGKCPSCSAWNSFVEELEIKEEPTKGSWRVHSEQSKLSVPIAIQTVQLNDQKERLQLPDKELNRVMGGGIVAGSVTLVGGEPGIGKSTLLLQLALNLPTIKILYVSGEESEQQIKLRAERIGIASEQCFVYSEVQTNYIFQQIEALRPQLVIIDSIQTLQSPYIESSAGSISQVRECAAELIRFAKETSTPVILVGHITKEGQLAGPKVLEHMVDTVLQFEGDRHHAYRLLRTSKNRFGSTSELGIYEMIPTGMREVSNPSEILITQRIQPISGISIGVTLEGNRPMLIEIQSLVSPAAYGTPQRSCTGFDSKRLHMLLAVLEKRGGRRFGMFDVFLNIAGGLYIDDPAIDLAIVISLISSFEDLYLPEKVCFSGEVGLGGEIRAVNRVENRISEAEKLGFEQIYLSGYNKKALSNTKFGIKVQFVYSVDELVGKFLET